MKKYIGLVMALVIMAVPVLAHAHVVVKPSVAGVGEFVTFDVSVPNEKDSAVTSVKLEIPAGLNYVTPTVKPGWMITTDKTGTGDSTAIRSITWADGTIDPGLRDDFTFAAQVPSKTGDINWKAYQTYADGTTVSWDQTPSDSESESEDSGPYSVTKVTDDLTDTKTVHTSNGSNLTLVALVVSLVAVLFAVGSIVFRKK